MPTFISHAAVPLSLGLGLGDSLVPRRLVAAGVVASLLPDLDVVGLRLGVPYAAALGHRGASHSLVAAAMIALVGAVLHRPLRAPVRTALAYLFVAAASHGLLDAITNGGLGVALLWPFSTERLFAPVRLIQVAPLGGRGLWSRGAAAFASELRWVWGPCVVVAVAIATCRRGLLAEPFGARTRK